MQCKSVKKAIKRKCGNRIVRPSGRTPLIRITKNMLDMLDRLGELKSLFHQNITQFIGLYPGTEKTIIMMSFAEKGSLKDLIADETIKFTWEMKMSLISDVGRGLGYLHKVDMPWPLEEFKLCSEQSVGLQDY